MRQVCQILCLLMLMLSAQHGAAVHELSHFQAAGHIDARADTGAVADSACALCPAYAQAVTPAFSHAFHIPFLVRADLERSAEPQFAAVTAAVPTPRSRGPPSSS
ncbi:MAG: hypothetical protein ACHQIL_00760 [Steroidobacterales bacterium]